MRVRLVDVKSLVRKALNETLEMQSSEGDKVNPTQFYPKDHELGMRVTKGGSMCANCKWVSDDEKSCNNRYFQAWQEKTKGIDDGSMLPAPADSYCCDNWQPTA